MKKILIIGAGFLQMFVIKKAKDMGYYTLAVDADPEAPGFAFADKYEVINIVDKEACLAFAKENQIDGVLTAATEYGVLTVSYIAQEMNLPGLKYSSAQRAKDKYKVKKCFIENHVDDSEGQVYEVNASADIGELSEKIIYPVIVKPCDGSGSRGTSRVDSPDDFLQACEFAMHGSISHRAEVESFVEGKEYGAESLVINGEVHVLAIMKKQMTQPPYYAELGHAVPCGLSFETEAKAKECVVKAIKALDINSGSVNTDMLITEDGKIHIVDIGARMGGNMIGPCIIPYGTGIDYMAAMLENAVDDFKEFKKTEPVAVATKLLAFPEGDIIEIPDVDEFQKKFDVELYHHMKAGQHVNEYHTNLDGLGYIVAKGETADEAQDKADRAYKHLAEVLF